MFPGDFVIAFQVDFFIDFPMGFLNSPLNDLSAILFRLERKSN